MSPEICVQPPVNLVSEINYDGSKTVSFLYDGTGDLIEMNDWNGKTTIAVDLLDRITKVTDHNGMVVQYAYDAAGNQISIGYPDCSQVDYWYNAENHVIQVQDFTGDATTYTYDANGSQNQPGVSELRNDPLLLRRVQPADRNGRVRSQRAILSISPTTPMTPWAIA